MRRRTFIGLGVLAGAGAGVGYWLRDRFFREVPPSPEETLEAMVAMVEPVLGTAASPAAMGLSLEPYRSLFQWRFENLRGEADRQRHLARLLNQLARSREELDFAQCDAATRRRILSATLDSPGGKEAGEALTGLIVRLFARTDSWTLLGYEEPPGTPRDLDRYTQSPISR